MRRNTSNTSNTVNELTHPNHDIKCDIGMAYLIVNFQYLQMAT